MSKVCRKDHVSLAWEVAQRVLQGPKVVSQVHPAFGAKRTRNSHESVNVRSCSSSTFPVCFPGAVLPSPFSDQFDLHQKAPSLEASKPARDEFAGARD